MDSKKHKQNTEETKPDEQTEVQTDKQTEEQAEKQTEKQTEEDLAYQTGLEEKVLDYIQTAQRLQADFDNYRKRSETLISQARYGGMEDAITKLIPVLDSIGSAKSMIQDEKLLTGFVMIENQLLNAFTSLGVEKIDALHKPFDHNLHNALAVQNNPDFEDGIVLQEYQAGYKLNDKVIRYSQVIVNKKED